jgi:plastocyanin
MTKAVLVAVAALTLSACGGDGGGASSAAEPAAGASRVDIKTFQYAPDPIEVEAGTTVTFVNADDTTHTVTAGTRKSPDPAAFDEKLGPKTGTAEVEFSEPGTYDYFCTLHTGPGMTAKVVVK